jgi:hypothetical protein
MPPLCLHDAVKLCLYVLQAFVTENWLSSSSSTANCKDDNKNYAEFFLIR